MKKVILMSVSLVAVLLTFTGCTTYYHDAGADYLYRPVSEINAPYYTEYEPAEQRISATGNASVLFGFIQLAENKRCLSVFNNQSTFFSILFHHFSPTARAVNNAKSVALYNACELHKADQLLGVTFDYVIDDYLIYSKVKCTVKGFPARVKGIKMIDKKPIILNKWEKIEYVAPYEKPRMLTPAVGKVVPQLSVFDFLKK